MGNVRIITKRPCQAEDVKARSFGRLHSVSPREAFLSDESNVHRRSLDNHQSWLVNRHFPLQNGGEVFVREARISIKHSAVGFASDHLRADLISENIEVTMVRNTATHVEHLLTNHTPGMDRKHHV